VTLNARMPPSDRCVLHDMLEAAADKWGDRPLMIFRPGESWSYARTRDLARRTACALSNLGVQRGDRVLVWLPTGEAIFRIHLGLSYLGAIFVPINPAKRGRSLEHMFRLTGARLLLMHAGLADRLNGLDLCELRTAVIVGGHAVVRDDLQSQTNCDVLAPADDLIAVDPPVHPSEPHSVFFTSGTTGAAKGVVCPHVHTTVQSAVALRFLTSEDRFLINVPYHYLGAAFIPFVAIPRGASMVLLREFRTDTFWNDVRETEATCCYAIGAISAFLMRQPEHPDDSRNTLRAVIQQPLAPDAAAFSRRFDVDVYTAIDMTEMPPAILSKPIARDRESPSGYVGQVTQVWPQFAVRLVDGFDCEVPDGSAGELVVRCEMPWVIAPYYLGDPQATSSAWRNGWFHTGDLLRRTASGDYFFVDRLKDAIRRRGENISSQEVEHEVLSYPDVLSCAAVGVRSEFGEQEVMVVIEPKPGVHFEHRALIEHLMPRMPAFMIPRYVRLMQKLPYTASNKVEKQALRADGITADTWDREAAGIVLRRQRLE
jgi:crotonobetaine/carnitine-CoA ligase